LQSNEETVETFTDDFPYLAFDLAASLAQYSYNAEAKVFLDSLRNLPGDADPAVLVELGRCNLALGDTSAAEECFLAAIDVDEMSIEPRIELANMYERAKEGEEALILAAEAMAIREAQGQGTVFPASSSLDIASNTSEYSARHRAAVGSVSRPPVPRIRPMIPRRYRPKRLADPTKRRQEEQAHAVKLAQQYQIVTDLKRQIADGQKELIPTWMASANELIDDFRSLKRFYTWDRYLNFLGSNSNEDPTEPRSAQENDLSQLYQRLARSKSCNITY
jgi:general transcription factor 3C polypeptide 3 (transcription factor C subunit 4)